MDELKTIEQVLAEGTQLVAKGDRAGAFACALVALDLDSNSEQAWLLRAQSTDDLDDAVNSLERVLVINPENAYARQELNTDRVVMLRRGVWSKLNLIPRPLLIANKLVRTLLIAGSTLLGAIVLIALCLALTLLSPRAASTTAETITPELVAAQLPATWTPIPTLLPTPTYRPPTRTPIPLYTATPEKPMVIARSKVNVNVRAGPGTMFPVLGRLPQDSPVNLVGIDSDGNFYQVEYSEEHKPGWVSVGLVEIGDGDVSALPIAIGPTPPRVVIRPTLPPTAPPTPLPQTVFVLIKNEPHRNCERWYIQGTVWDRGYGNGFVPGTQVRVWVNDAVYQTAVTHYGRNPAYWEVNFIKNQVVNGFAAIVDANGQLLSQRYPFALSADCSVANSVNEIIMDFSH